MLSLLDTLLGVIFCVGYLYLRVLSLCPALSPGTTSLRGGSPRTLKVSVSFTCRHLTSGCRMLSSTMREYIGRKLGHSTRHIYTKTSLNSELNLLRSPITGFFVHMSMCLGCVRVVMFVHTLTLQTQHLYAILNT